jgi:hypothetical protein
MTARANPRRSPATLGAAYQDGTVATRADKAPSRRPTPQTIDGLDRPAGMRAQGKSYEI